MWLIPPTPILVGFTMIKLFIIFSANCNKHQNKWKTTEHALDCSNESQSHATHQHLTLHIPIVISRRDVSSMLPMLVEFASPSCSKLMQYTIQKAGQTTHAWICFVVARPQNNKATKLFKFHNNNKQVPLLETQLKATNWHRKDNVVVSIHGPKLPMRIIATAITSEK